MPAKAWFDGIPDDRYELLEFSVRFEEGVYTLLHLSDERLLAERLPAKRSWSMDDDE